MSKAVLERRASRRETMINKFAVILDHEGSNFSELGSFKLRREAIRYAINKSIDYAGNGSYILVQNRISGKFIYRKRIKSVSIPL